MQRAGAKIGRFEIEREAASGGAGTVYRARDPETGEVVALKLIRGLQAADLQRFAREARLLAQIRHPGVVRYVAHGAVDGGGVYLAMEWLDGEDLRDRLARTGLTLAETVLLGRRVAEALAEIHAHQLIHRDVKPGNLFLPGGVVDQVKVIDFGLARGDGSLGPTQTGIVVGTPAYMAPEQARGQRRIDARADVYSLGCVLYKTLAGRAPFQGRDLMTVLTRVLFEEPRRIYESRPDVPAPLDDLVLRMLAKEPDGRPQSAAAVAEALAALGTLADRDDEAQPGPLSAPPAGLMMGERRIVAMLLVGGGRDEATVDASPRVPRVGRESDATVANPPEHGQGGPGEGQPADAVVEAVVREHGGQIDRLLDGTWVVALSGASVATDQAARAARCALALRAVLPGAPMVLAMRRSEVDRRLPIGAAVDEAAKMLRARVGTERATAIGLDDVTAALLDPRFDVGSDAAGPCLLGLRDVGESGARTLLGRDTPFVGREWEMASIQELWARCTDEPQALALLVTAPAGAGKTRFAREVLRAISEARAAEGGGLSVWSGRADPLRAGSALELLAQLVRSACGIRAGDTARERRERIVRRVDLHVAQRDGSRVAEFLGEIVGAPFPDEESFELRAARRDPRIMSEQARRAFHDFLAAECEVHPVLIVAEDLQWSDASTLRFLDGALQALARRPWMILALSRTEIFDLHPRLWKERNLQEIRLRPLAPRAAKRLVQEVLGAQFAVDDATAAQLADKADGNAFYLEELIRAVAARFAANDRAAPDGAALPETVLAMVQSRLEALDADARRVLRAASVFGEVFWPAGVTRLLDGGAPTPATEPSNGMAVAEGWVEVLVKREVLARRRESRFPGEDEVAFRHGLLREGAYAMLTERDRALGHALAGAWLEAHGEHDPMVLARHFQLGGEEARAGVFYLRAAEQALHGADLEAAVAHAEAALACGIEGDPRVACLGLLSETHAYAAEWEKADLYAGEVARLAAPGTDAWLRAMTAKHSAAYGLGRPQEFLEALFTLMGVDAAPEAGGTIVRCLSVSVLVCCIMGQYPFVEGILHRVDALGAPVVAADPVTRGWVELSHAWWETWKTGDLGDALAHAEAARRSFESASDRRHATFARLFVGVVRWNLGMFEDAERELRGVVVGGDDNLHLVPMARSFYLAEVLMDRGALDEAREVVVRRVEGLRGKLHGNDAVREARARWQLAEIALRGGHLDAADREITAWIDTLRLAPLDWQMAATTLAGIRLAQGRAAAAAALAGEVMDALTAYGSTGQRAGRCRLVHAECLLALGSTAALPTLAAARAHLLARAARVADPEARRAFLALPEHVRTLALAEARLGAG